MARRQKDPVLLAAETWLNNNPGKKLKDFYAATSYEGKPLKTKQKAGQPAVVSYRTAASTTGPAQVRKERIHASETQYIEELKSNGYSDKEARKALQISKDKTKKIEKQRTALNKEKGPNSFTLGHQTAAAEGGGDFGRNTRLERGLGEGGNYSRGAGDEMSPEVKRTLGVPSSGKEAAQMDLTGDFDQQLTPKDRQDIVRHPEKADDIISNRQKLIASNPNAAPLNVKKTQKVTEQIQALKGTLPDIPTPNRKALAALAATGLAAPSVLGTAASAAETTGRAQLANKTRDPADYLQAGISGLSLISDLVPGIGEFVSTPADLANVMIDQHRNGGSKFNGSGNGPERNGNGNGHVKVGTNHSSGGRSGAKRRQLQAKA